MKLDAVARNDDDNGAKVWNHVSFSWNVSTAVMCWEWCEVLDGKGSKNTTLKGFLQTDL